MKTEKKAATQAKTLRYEVSISGSEAFKTNDKELAQEQAEKFKSEFALAIHFVDHKQKEHWYYERTNQQKNYRAFQITYTAPKVAVETPAIES